MTVAGAPCSCPACSPCSICPFRKTLATNRTGTQGLQSASEGPLLEAPLVSQIGAPPRRQAADDPGAGAGGRNVSVGLGLPADEGVFSPRFRFVVGGLGLRATGAPSVVVVVVAGGLRTRRGGEG